jgi:hypothetical protein
VDVAVRYFVVGLTVGADGPASWTLITETAPANARGRLAGLAQVLWYVGAMAPLLLGIALRDALHAADRRVSGRRMLLCSSVLQVLGFVPFILLDVSFLTALINVILFGVGAGIGQQSLFSALERRAVPDAVALDRAGLHVRRRAHRPGRVEPAAADGPGGRLPHALDRPGADADRVRHRRGPLRTAREGPRPWRAGRWALQP